MATYSNLGIKLITTGDESGTWGTSTNTNFSDVIDEAIAGVVTYNIGSDANFTLTVSDATSSDARHAVIKFTSTTLTATRTCTLAPDDLQKVWVVVNATTGGQSLTFKQGSSGATVTVPNGESAIIYSDGAGASAGAITRVLDSFTNTKVTTGTLSTSGNLTFSSTAQRITGDMSNATITNRLMVQTSTTNGNTLFSVMPNGTGTAALVRAFNSSTPAQFVDIRIDGTEAQLRSSYEGTSTFLPLTFYTGGSERMRLDTSGNLGIGGTANANAKAEVLGTLPSSSGASRGVIVSGTFPSGATTSANAFTSFPSTEAASFTASILRHFFASQGTIGAGSAVTSQFGFAVNSNLTGATNNYGFYSDIASGSNRWNFYAAGTARNYFAGGVEDAAGNLRAIPPVGTKTSSYTLATGDVGKYVQVGTSGSITIPDATFAEGDVVSIFNNTTGNVTLTCSITTAYIAGTDSDKATMTLATRGVATVLFISSTVCVVSGNVS